jgi:hypothetical protein
MRSTDSPDSGRVRSVVAVAVPDASGGGCGAWATSGPYSVKACISATGIAVHTGAFLSARANNLHCEIDVVAYSAGQKAGESDYNCTVNPGPYEGPGWLSIASNAQTVVYFKLNGQTVITAYSPVLNT